MKSSKRKHTPSSHTLTPELAEAITNFFQNNSPKHFSRGLRKMIVELLTYQETSQAMYMSKFIVSLEAFFEVLDMAEDGEKFLNKDIGER